jgi:regulator of cell morphogenesis and NO signaling
MIATPETTIRDIVADDFRSAAVFDRYGIDFCCGGGRTVAEACREHRICEAENNILFPRARALEAMGTW